MHRGIFLGLGELNITIVTCTFEGYLGHGVNVHFGIGGLYFTLVEHWLQRSRFVVSLAVEELNLQEIMPVIQVVSYKVAYQFFNHQSLIYFHILV